MARKVNVFRNKNFALLFYGVLVSNVAHILFNFVMSLYVLRIAKEVYGETYAPLVQGIYLGLAGFVLVAFMPFGGVLADRINKVRIMYFTDYIRGFVILIVGILIFMNPPAMTKLIALFIMSFVLGINSAFFNPASGSLLKFIVSEEELPQASSYLHGSMNLQNIAGLILGGIMFSILNVYVIFIINGVGYLISALTEMFIKYDHKDHQTSDVVPSVLGEIKSGLKYLYDYKPMFRLIIMALALNFFMVPILNNGFPYFIEFGLAKETTYLFDSFLTIENWYSVLLVSFSVSGIIMALILSAKPKKDKYGKDLIKAIIHFSIGIVGISLFMILYYLEILNVGIVLVALVVINLFLGLASTSFNVPVHIIMQHYIEPKQLGKVISVSSVLSQALIPLASLLAGVIISQFSIITMYLLCTVGLIMVTIIYYRSRSYEKL